MKLRTLFWLSLAASFSAGLTSGALGKPDARLLKARLDSIALRAQMRRVSHRLSHFEQRFESADTLYRSLHDRLVGRLESAGRHLTERHVPLSGEGEAWDIADRDITRDLRRLPRR